MHTLSSFPTLSTSMGLDSTIDCLHVRPGVVYAQRVGTDHPHALPASQENPWIRALGKQAAFQDQCLPDGLCVGWGWAAGLHFECIQPQMESSASHAQPFPSHPFPTPENTSIGLLVQREPNTGAPRLQARVQDIAQTIFPYRDPVVYTNTSLDTSTCTNAFGRWLLDQYAAQPHAPVSLPLLPAITAHAQARERALLSQLAEQGIFVEQMALPLHTFQSMLAGLYIPGQMRVWFGVAESNGIQAAYWGETCLPSPGRPMSILWAHVLAIRIGPY